MWVLDEFLLKNKDLTFKWGTKTKMVFEIKAKNLGFSFEVFWVE